MLKADSALTATDAMASRDSQKEYRTSNFMGVFCGRSLRTRVAGCPRCVQAGVCAHPNKALLSQAINLHSSARNEFKSMFKRIFLTALVLTGVCVVASAEPAHKTENIFLITVDGMRWQEVFTGMEEQLATKDYGVWDTNRLRSWFWRE